MRARQILIALLSLSVTACAAIPLPLNGLNGGESSPSLERKLVVGKEASVTLIAEDGTRCITSRTRFDRTRIGSKVWCVWSGGGRADAALGR